MGTKNNTATLYVVCPKCRTLYGQCDNAAGVALLPLTCLACGVSNTVTQRKPRREQVHRGALAPDKYLSEGQMAMLRQYAASLAYERKSRRARTDQLIIEILALSGLRASELCDLKLIDCPCVHGKLFLMVRDGKGNVSRAVHISQGLSDTIAAYVSDFCKGDGPDEYLVRGETGHRIFYRRVWQKVSRLGKGVGLDISPHTLRHTYATTLYNTEKDLVFVQQQLGHRNTTTTAIYARTSNEACRRQAAAMK